MDRFAEVCERVASYNSRLKKIAIVAEYLHELADDDLARAVRFFCCGPVSGMPASVNLFGEQEKRTLSIGHSVLRAAALPASGWDTEMFRICHQETGDAGETISLLMRGRSKELPMSLAEADRRYRELYLAHRSSEKAGILGACFSSYRPLAIKYFVKVITGNLRIGLMVKQVEEAVAAAMGVSLDEIRSANNRLGNLPAVALVARTGELHTIEARLFHPMEFMLAKPLDALSEAGDAREYLIEDKYDGIRSQVHIANGRAVIYTRGLDDATAAFPEIERALLELPGSGILDGEILAWSNGRPAPFTVLQQRTGRKMAPAEIMRKIPVAFMAYDILYRNGELLIDRPLEERRRLLEQIIGGRSFPLLLSAQYEAPSGADLDRLFEDARLRGNEGLLLKRRGSVYESGKRSDLWYKLKRPYATLDVVVTAAEQGHGRRATMLSDYTFAVRSGAEFVNVGKAYSGLTDVEVRELTRLLRSLATERFGRVMLVRPQVVLEVAFDGIQQSARHKGGFALRFPRIVRWRRDKGPADADDLERVRALYNSSLNLTAAHD
jgi:DNA ligase-1